MVIGLLEIGFARQIVLVVLVRRIARGVAARRDHLDHQQRIGRLALRQDVGDVARVGALAAHLLAEVVRRDDARPAGRRRGPAPSRPRVRDRSRPSPTSPSPAAHRPTTACLRRATCARRARRDPCRRPCALPLPVTKTRQTSRSPVLRRDRLARLQPVQVEADIGPAGALRRDMGDAAVACLRLHQQFRHRAHSLFRLCRLAAVGRLVEIEELPDAHSRPCRARSCPRTARSVANSKIAQAAQKATSATRRQSGRKNGCS